MDCGLPSGSSLAVPYYLIYKCHSSDWSFFNWLFISPNMASVEASDAAAADAPSQGEPKRQRCQSKDVSVSPFAVRRVVVTTDHGAQHTSRAQQLAEMTWVPARHMHRLSGRGWPRLRAQPGALRAEPAG